MLNIYVLNLYTWTAQAPQTHHFETLASILSFAFSVIHVTTHPLTQTNNLRCISGLFHSYSTYYMPHTVLTLCHNNRMRSMPL